MLIRAGKITTYNISSAQSTNHVLRNSHSLPSLARIAEADCYNAMVTERKEAKKHQKLCFVTIGATASFDALIEACLAPGFLQALHYVGYTHLLIQYGKEYGEKFINVKKAVEQNYDTGINISGYDFKTSGTLYDMRAAKGHWGGTEGSVISHAGL